MLLVSAVEWNESAICIHTSPPSGGFPGGADGKQSARNAGDLGSIPGSGRSPGEGNGNPLQYSCLENPMDRGAWWATVHGGAVRPDWVPTTSPPLEPHSLHPPSHPSRSSQGTELSFLRSSCFPLAMCFTHGSVNVSMLTSQITTPWSVPTRQFLSVCISILALLKPEADRQVSFSGSYNSIPQISAVPELSQTVSSHQDNPALPQTIKSHSMSASRFQVIQVCLAFFLQSPSVFLLPFTQMVTVTGMIQRQRLCPKSLSSSGKRQIVNKVCWDIRQKKYSCYHLLSRVWLTETPWRIKKGI